MIGAFFPELMRDFANEFFQRRQDTVFGTFGKPAGFLPVQFNLTGERHGDQLAGAEFCWFIWLWINRNQNAFDQQVLRAHQPHRPEGSLEFSEGRARQRFDRAENVHVLSRDLPVPRTAPRAKLLIIRNDSDTDGKFAEIAKAGNIPLVVIDNVLNLRGPLQELFAGG